MGTDLYRVGDTQTRLRSVVHSLGLIIGSFAAGILLALLAFQLLPLFGITIENPQNPPLSIEVLSTALQFVGFYAVCLWYLQWRGDDGSLFDISVPSLREAGWALLGLVALLVGVQALGAVLAQFGITTAEHSAISKGQANPEYFLYLIPVTLLFIAPAEELLFRGIVQGLFRRAYGVVPGVAITSVLFGVVHITALLQSGAGRLSILATLALTAALGSILGALYEWTQNLSVTVMAHGVYNSVLFYGQYLVATGQLQLPG